MTCQGRYLPFAQLHVLGAYRRHDISPPIHAAPPASCNGQLPGVVRQYHDTRKDAFSSQQELATPPSRMRTRTMPAARHHDALAPRYDADAYSISRRKAACLRATKARRDAPFQRAVELLALGEMPRLAYYVGAALARGDDDGHG